MQIELAMGADVRSVACSVWIRIRDLPGTVLGQ